MIAPPAAAAEIAKRKARIARRKFIRDYSGSQVSNALAEEKKERLFVWLL